MTAPINNSQLRMITAETMSFRAPLLMPERPSLLAQFRAAIDSLLARIQRHSVISELNTLSDRELADIGLNRNDLGRVFDPRFIHDRHYT